MTTKRENKEEKRLKNKIKRNEEMKEKNKRLRLNNDFSILVKKIKFIIYPSYLFI